MPDENNTTSEIKTPIGSISFAGKKMAEFISVICLAFLFLLAYVLWEHKTDTKDCTILFVNAVEKMTNTHQAAVKEQRVMNCLLATKQDDRRTMLSECERIAR